MLPQEKHCFTRHCPHTLTALPPDDAGTGRAVPGRCGRAWESTHVSEQGLLPEGPHQAFGVHLSQPEHVEGPPVCRRKAGLGAVRSAPGPPEQLCVYSSEREDTRCRQGSCVEEGRPWAGARRLTSHRAEQSPALRSRAASPHSYPCSPSPHRLPPCQARTGRTEQLRVPTTSTRWPCSCRWRPGARGQRVTGTALGQKGPRWPGPQWPGALPRGRRSSGRTGAAAEEAPRRLLLSRGVGAVTDPGAHWTRTPPGPSPPGRRGCRSAPSPSTGRLCAP